MERTETDRSASWPVWGTTATVQTEHPGTLVEACRIACAELAAVDAAANRFRADSELSLANAAAGRWTGVTPLFAELLTAALAVAADTDGAVDPTLGRSLRRLGYDRDFGSLVLGSGRLRVRHAGPNWEDVELDQRRSRVKLPAGVELDLGATAKARTADRAAARIAAVTGASALVNLGGDLAAAGCGDRQPYRVRLAEDHRAQDGPVVAAGDGGIATSSTTVRRWAVEGGEAHHLLDPLTGLPAAGPWRTATVAASSCLAANAAATAAIVLGDGAVTWLAGARVPARLVDRAGAVRTVNGWPEDAA